MIDIVLLTSSVLLGLAFYGFLTVRHIVKIIAYFILSAAGLILLASRLSGESTSLFFLFMVLAATEESVGLTLAVLYYKKKGDALLNAGGEKRCH